MKCSDFQNLLRRKANPRQAQILSRFFKTGPGEYGEGDQFLGLKVPQIRTAIRGAGPLSLTEIRKLSQSKYHEERLAGFLFLVNHYQKAQSEGERSQIVKTYLGLFPSLNNWDLIDTSAPLILGPHFFLRDRSPLLKWAKSKSLWKRRTAVLTTFYFIRQKDFSTTLQLAEMLRDDEHDLIHKAVGWMLREVGKRDLNAELRFLRRHYKKMPRTMLRYAIEKLPESQRQAFLQSKV